MSKVQIFNIYHKHAPLIKSECIRPIQTGCAAATELLGPEFLRDDTGDNISNKNPHYAELTAHYWVWKNVLPNNPDLQYVGFCHYRRILDFWTSVTAPICVWRWLLPDKLIHYINRYVDGKIMPMISGYDIILPARFHIDYDGFATVEAQYKHYSPPEIWETARQVINEEFPDYTEDFDRFCKGSMEYLVLNFIMRRELYEKYMAWEFELLSKVEERLKWEDFDSDGPIKNPALLIERIINVWIMHEIRVNGAKILERQMYYLEGEKRPLLKFRWFMMEKFFCTKHEKGFRIQWLDKSIVIRTFYNPYHFIPGIIKRIIPAIAKKEFKSFVRSFGDITMGYRRAFLIFVPRNTNAEIDSALIKMLNRLKTELCMVAVACDVPCNVSRYCRRNNIPYYSNMALMRTRSQKSGKLQQKLAQLQKSFDGCISTERLCNDGIDFCDGKVKWWFHGAVSDFKEIIKGLQ